MILKEFNYYLKNGMSLEEIQGAILEKVNSLSDPFTGCIAHVFDASALKYYIVASDNVVALYELDRNILSFNDSSNNINELNGLINTKFSELTSRVDSVNNELGNRINEVNSNLENSINAKANQTTTYNKTEVNNLLNAKANSNAVVALSGNQTIAGVKTFSSVPISATNPTANNQVANKAYVDTVANAKANANATVNLTGNQTIAGTKTFSSPVVVPNATANNHAVNLAQLNTKANQATTYNKNEVDTRVNSRATWEHSYPRAETYTKVEVNNLLNSKANQANTYTKAEVDGRVNAKANSNAVVNLNGNQTINGVKTFTSNITAPNITALQNQMNGLASLSNLVSGGKSPYLLHDGVVRITVGNGGNFRNFTDALNYLKQNSSKQYIEIILTSDFNENITLSDLPPCSINSNYRKLGNNLHIKNSPGIYFNTRDFSYSGTLTIENSNVNFAPYCNLRNKIIATNKSKVSFGTYTNRDNNNILFLEAYDSSIFVGDYSVFKSDNTPCIVADDNSTIWLGSYVNLSPANNHAAIVSKFGSLIICKGRFYRQNRGRYFAWVDNGGRIIGDLFGSNIVVNTSRTNVAPNTWSPNGMILGRHWG